MAGFIDFSYHLQYSLWQNYNPEFVLNDATMWSSTRLYSMKSADFYPLVLCIKFHNYHGRNCDSVLIGWLQQLI